MANIQTSIWNVPNDKALKQRDFICEEFGYQDTIDGQPNPETKAQFAQRMGDKYYRDWHRNIFERKNRELRARTQTPSEDDIEM